MPSLLNDDECLVEVFFRMRSQNRFDLLMDGIYCGGENTQIYDAGTGALHKYQTSVVPVARNQYPALFPRMRSRSASEAREQPASEAVTTSWPKPLRNLAVAA